MSNAVRNGNKDLQAYSIATLKSLCMKNKASLGIRCAGKGVTKAFLYNALARAGLLGAEDEGSQDGSSRDTNEFEALIHRADPEFHKIVKGHMETLPDIRGSHGDRKRVDTSESIWSPWMEVYREHELMLRTAETETPSVIGNVLNVLQTGKWVGDSIIDNIRTFDALFPLISYIYALENADYIALCTQGGINGPFLLSAAALSPKKRIKAPSTSKKSVSDSQIEADYSLVLTAMPTDMMSEIMSFVPFHSYTSVILTAKSFSKADRENRFHLYSYGSYTLSQAQALAMRWMQEKPKTRLFTIKAPPSWGKTILMLAAAIEHLKKGKKVIVYTRKDMIHTFLREMEAMMGSRFPDMSLHKAQDGKYDILVPALSEKERKRFKAGEGVDLLLLSSPQSPNSALSDYIKQIPTSRVIDNYSADFVILDEAHKGVIQGHIVWDNLFRNSSANFLMVSASDIVVVAPHGYDIPLCPEVDDFFVRRIGAGIHIRCEDMKSAAISFKMKTIEGKVPSYSIEFLEKIDTSTYVPKYNNTMANRQWDYEAAVNRLSIMKNLQKGLKGLKGNIVVFVKSIPVISGIALKRLKDGMIGWRDIKERERDIPFDEYVDFVEENDYIWHKGASSLAKFVEESVVKPSVFITTYRKGAVGINLNTVGTVVLTNADTIGVDMFYQAISRGLRVNNRASTIRVVAMTEKKLFPVMKILTNTTTEDFRDEYRKVIGFPVKTPMGPYLNAKRGNLLSSLISQGKDVTVEELYVLLGRPLGSKSARIRTDVKSFLEEHGMFTGLDFKRLKSQISGLHGHQRELIQKLDEERILKYFWDKWKVVTTRLEE